MNQYFMNPFRQHSTATITLVLSALCLLLCTGARAQSTNAPIKKPPQSSASSVVTQSIPQGRVLTAQPQGLDQRLVVFPYDPNAIYPILAKVANFTHISLSANEQMIGLYLSDSLSWEVHVMADKRGFMIKPKAAGLRNTATVKTNKRTYELDFKEVKEENSLVWHQRVSWQVAEPAYEDLSAPQLATAQQNNPVGIPAVASNNTSTTQAEEGNECRGLMVDISRLSQQYTVKGDAPFAPKGADSLVFDTGMHTYVRLPANVQEVPAIFGLDRSGQAELVNYRYVCGMYKIDRVMDYGLLLKLGDQEVKITRKTANCGWFGWNCAKTSTNISQ